MREFTETINGFKVRGMQDEKTMKWYIRTWPEGKDVPERHYWFFDESFFDAHLNMAPSGDIWQTAAVGKNIDGCIDPAEKQAVFLAIQKHTPEMAVFMMQR